MKTDLYSKVMLTVIAACLVLLIIQNQATRQSQPVSRGAMDVNIVGVSKELPVAIQNQKSDTSPKSPIEVKIVGTTADLPVAIQNQKSFEFPTGPIDINIKSVGGDTLSRVGSKVVLPVGVHNTVETKIVGPMFSGLGTLGKEGLGVVLLNR